MSTVTRNCRPGLVRVGPFELIQPVATGSTATVWRGVHRRSGVPVAIKVLTHARWRDEKRGGPLELEVRTLARLNHPAVIAVHDYGWLTASEEAASRGALIAGCPYVMMDWHGGGTLSGFAPFRTSPWNIEPPVRDGSTVTFHITGHHEFGGAGRRDHRGGLMTPEAAFSTHGVACLRGAFAD